VPNPAGIWPDFKLERNMKNSVLLIAAVLTAISTNLYSNELISKSKDGARVYFISPLDGQTVPQNFRVVFGLQDMGVAPAGTKKDFTGHHHLLIATDSLPAMNMPLPATEKIRHFGGGQTETELTLSPGEHSLQLLLGNFAHVPHDKPLLSEKITIIVK
jgi:hypothetical protein